MRCEIKSGGWKNSLRYSDPDAIQIILQIWKGKGERFTHPKPLWHLAYCCMACVCNWGRTGFDVVTFCSVNRSWRSMKVIFLSDPEIWVSDFPLSVVSWQLFSIREPCGAHHSIPGLTAALVLWSSLTHFPALLGVCFLQRWLGDCVT